MHACLARDVNGVNLMLGTIPARPRVDSRDWPSVDRCSVSRCGAELVLELGAFVSALNIQRKHRPPTKAKVTVTIGDAYQAHSKENMCPRIARSIHNAYVPMMLYLWVGCLYSCLSTDITSLWILHFLVSYSLNLQGSSLTPNFNYYRFVPTSPSGSKLHGSW